MAKSMKNWVLALGAVFLISACGVADDTVEARLTQAQIEINQGNYAEAIVILEEVCDPLDLAACEDATLMMLAEAYMGSGGVDLLNLLADAAAGTSPDTFTMVQTMAGAADAAPKVAALENAILALEAMTVRDANASLILAVASTTHTVMLITDAKATATAAADIVLDVIADMESMLAAVDILETELGLPTDLTNDLVALIADMGGADDGFGNVTLSDTDLQNFINSLP